MNQIVNNLITCASCNVRVFGKCINLPINWPLLSTKLYSQHTIEIRGKKVTVNKIQEIFNVRHSIALLIARKYKKFSDVTSTRIEENYKLCVNLGVRNDILLKYPEMLAQQDLSTKLLEVRCLPYDVNKIAPILCLTLRRLRKLIQENVSFQRIKLLSQALEVEESEMCEIFLRKPFMQSLDLELLDNNIKILTEYGITKKEILRDLWVLRYSPNVIKERLELAKKNSIERMKTWMVRSQPEIFERYVKRRTDNKFILGNNSVAEYLSTRLSCSPELARYLISKQPALESKSLTKMNEIIDFLYMRGFKPEHICRVPKVLLHSIETTKKRLQEIEAHGTQLDSLSILTKSQKQYMQYYENILNKNKKGTG